MRAAAVLVAVLVSVIALDRLFPPPLERLDAVGSVVRDRDGRVLRAFPVEDGKWRLAAQLDAIDPDFIDALLAYEDARFYQHGGVDGQAVLRAARQNLGQGRVVSGASTITMQLARLLEPRPRTWLAKIQQAVRAIQIEARLDKQDILEAYLTLAPYGGNLEGVRAASWAYFGREPDDLTPEQIALLIALPQSPEARRPDLRPDAAIAARGRVLDRLASLGHVDARQARDAAQDPAPQRRAFPSTAWHVAEQLAAQAQSGSATGREIVSTLDHALQSVLEEYLAESLPLGDEHAQIAVLVVETESRAVRAAVGSASRERAGGWIDLTNRPRSPGSTLKPFIYGLAFDDGLAAAGTRIADLPRRFAGYRPDNFDRRFRGDVTISEALQHSLNVPAVTALDGVGARRFSAALDYAGARPERPRTAGRDDGLAVALGGAGLSARQLAVLYGALGDGGRALPLRWTEDAPVETAAYAVLSEETSRELIEILRRAPHPAGRMPAHLARSAPDIAFKTGTSYGFRDAWAAGISGGFTIIVWTGRADGAPREGMTGREIALPLLFRTADLAHSLLPDVANDFDEAEFGAPDTPVALRQFQADPAPHILFPPDGAEVWSDSEGRGFVLAGQGASRLAWYADGLPVVRNAAGDPVWYPDGEGFFEISAVDARGRETRSRVRIRSAG